MLYSRLTMIVKMEMESHPIEESLEAAVPMEIESSGDQYATTTTTTTSRLRRKAASRPNLNPTVAVIKMERDPIEEAEAIIPVEVVSSGGQSAIEEPEPEAIIPNETLSSGTGRLRRKAARRSEPLFIRRSPRRLGKAAAEDAPARKKPRLEEPLPTTTNESAGNTASTDVSVVLSPPDAAADDDDANTNAESVTDTQPNDVASGTTGSWTSEEDAKLTNAVTNTRKKKYGKEYKTDWVAGATLVPGRTRQQCWCRWKYVLVSNIDPANGRKGGWTEDEDSKLKDAVQTHGGKNWIAIAALVPGRTQKQCCRRWHDVLSHSIDRASGRKGEWTEDEDDKLNDAVQTHGGKNWIAIARLVPGRTRNQCRNRWHYALNPSVDLAAGHTGKWTPDEDDKLKDSVQMRGGKNWRATAALVPGRTQRQCCRRWHAVLDPSIDRASGRKGEWTEDEDRKLKDAV
jgi:hypothetical protein